MPKTRRSPYFTYPIELPIEYELEAREWIAGQGRTLSISSEIVRFECNRPLPVDRKIRLVLGWPVTLPDGTGLNLWIVGEIKSSEFRQVTVRVGSYEFRTRRALQHANQRARLSTFLVEPPALLSSTVPQ